MSIYVPEMTIHAGETKLFESVPDASVAEPPDISSATLRGTFTPTDGSAGFVIDAEDFTIDSPNWSTTITHANTVNRGGQRLKWKVEIIDEGSEAVLNWGYIFVRA